MKFEKSCGAVLYTMRNNHRNYVIVKGTTGQHWGIPKGHVEDGETEQETALREIFEETGTKAQLLDGFREQIEYDMPNGVRKTVVYFAALYENQELKSNPQEISSLMLVPIDKALEMVTHDAVREVFLKADDWLNNLE